MTARDPIDALAEAIWAWRDLVDSPPLWVDLSERDREWWRKQALFVRDRLTRRGFELAPAPVASGGTEP